MKFKLKEGTHIQGGRTYTKGQTVESDLDLTTLFKEKFEKIHESEPVAPKLTEADPKPPAAPAKKKKAKKGEEWGDND